ncbi:hypothetical protein RAZWK3B_20666 [Roseobacter sp. AzwK-3b]|uniref:hypothetical protein n=1 Tax=Roseobacter sp. AzwK-3b TaxID=351016 RepID=UPI0001569C20|nr:hypothetical protein [Roseobacter sp. AzwK-3b]EDM71804.1 hypothetical protein RAZWK3B_20666 [Roseobacter sp. AzwK-3b]
MFDIASLVKMDVLTGKTPSSEYGDRVFFVNVGKGAFVLHLRGELKLITRLAAFAPYHFTIKFNVD